MNIDDFLVDHNDNIMQAIEKIKINSHRAVFVSNKLKIIGVISEGDVLNTLMEQTNLSTNVKKIMQKSFYFLEKEDLELAKRVFKNKLISVIPVVNKKMEVKKLITIDMII